MTSLAANPMICRSGRPLYWRAVRRDDGLWVGQLGYRARPSGGLDWEEVGAPKDYKADAEGTAVDFARVRAGRL